MENSFEQYPEIQIPDPCVSCRDFNWENTKNSNPEIEASAMEEDENGESLADLMVCDSGSRLVPSGFINPPCSDEIVLFVML
ncbi:hypothetical protein MIMGU_mgv1a0006151mg, partial [Erythranthe guttata]